MIEKRKNLFVLLFVIVMSLSCVVYGENADTVANISSVAEVPLITLNNGVQVPQLGLGTQIQRLESDSSESGRKLLNDTSHDAVVAALEAGAYVNIVSS